MKRKSYSILYLLLFFNCPVITGQLNYEYNGVTYALSSSRTMLFSDVVFNDPVSSSRVLTAQISQARLKSAELMGLYLIFSRSYTQDQKTQDLFPLFVKYYGKGFNVEVSDLITKRITGDSDARKIRFECPVKKYEISEIDMADLPDLNSLCEKEYRNSRDIYSAERYISYCPVSPADQLRMNAGFLSRQNAPLPVMAKCYGLEPGTVFESTLFGSGETGSQLVYELLAEKEVAGQFSKRLILMDLIAVSDGFEAKDAYYTEFLSNIEKSDELWDDILLFASEYAEGEEPFDAFSAIQRYPGALNLHLFSGSNDVIYKKALLLFNDNKQDSAIISIRDAVNFNGVTLEKIILSAAVYRIQKDYQKSLIMSVISAFNGIDTDYVPGNLYLSLKALNYNKTEQLKTYLLNNITCDKWSFEVISNN
ncbi:hypothetical protein ACE01N_02390 [Saccharicrinis sp. FJH2]|uniref:hypothetical protein n=1 Tax=Saccharicrinis sp. FJH65 TaxID=3344659 RepID=UPI0035F2BCA9